MWCIKAVNSFLIRETQLFWVGSVETNPIASGDEIAKVLKAAAGKVLFKGDTRGVGDIFNKRFESRGINTDIMEYVETNTVAIF